MSNRLRVAFALPFLVTGCADDEAPLGPLPADISGVWAYSASFSGAGISCRVDDMFIRIEQRSSEVAGRTAPGAILTCGPGGGTGLRQYYLEDGSLDGNAISFGFETQEWTHEGEVGGNVMSGKVRVELAPPIPAVLHGTFTATKQE